MLFNVGHYRVIYHPNAALKVLIEIIINDIGWLVFASVSIVKSDVEVSCIELYLVFAVQSLRPKFRIISQCVCLIFYYSVQKKAHKESQYDHTNDGDYSSKDRAVFSVSLVLEVDRVTEHVGISQLSDQLLRTSTGTCSLFLGSFLLHI